MLVQFGFGARATRHPGPFVDGFVEDVNVAFVRRHRVGGDVARADAGKHARDFGKLGQKSFFNFHVGAQRFVHAHADGLVEH